MLIRPKTKINDLQTSDGKQFQLVVEVVEEEVDGTRQLIVRLVNNAWAEQVIMEEMEDYDDEENEGEAAKCYGIFLIPKPLDFKERLGAVQLNLSSKEIMIETKVKKESQSTHSNLCGQSASHVTMTFAFNQSSSK